MIYKILTAAQWEQFQEAGVFDGAPVDLTDGFIHFSAADQVAGTAAKHFSGQDGLIIASVDEKALGESVKWEVSRGGEKFPHLYAKLRMTDIVNVCPLEEFTA